MLERVLKRGDEELNLKDSTTGKRDELPFFFILLERESVDGWVVGEVVMWVEVAEGEGESGSGMVVFECYRPSPAPIKSSDR